MSVSVGISQIVSKNFEKNEKKAAYFFTFATMLFVRSIEKVFSLKIGWKSKHHVKIEFASCEF